MTEDSNFHWQTKPRHLESETARRAGLEFVCVFGHDALAGAFFQIKGAMKRLLGVSKAELDEMRRKEREQGTISQTLASVTKARLRWNHVHRWTGEFRETVHLQPIR